MRFKFTIIVLILISSLTCFTQKPIRFEQLIEQCVEREAKIDSTIIELIKMAESSYINDTLKVDIINFLGEIKSDTAIKYLIRNITYNKPLEESGDTGLDDERARPYFYTLIKMLRNNDITFRWLVYQHLLNELTKKEEDDSFLYRSAIILSLFYDKRTILLLQSEIEQADKIIPFKFQNIYRKNLTKIVSNFEKF